MSKYCIINNLPPLYHAFLKRKKEDLGLGELAEVNSYYLLNPRKFNEEFKAYLKEKGIEENLIKALEMIKDAERTEAEEILSNLDKDRQFS